MIIHTKSASKIFINIAKINIIQGESLKKPSQKSWKAITLLLVFLTASLITTFLARQHIRVMPAAGTNNYEKDRTFGIVCPAPTIRSVTNFYTFFRNQSIKYQTLWPSTVTTLECISHFDALVVWTKKGYLYNATAIKEFAKTRIVISHMWDFCNMLYPSLSNSTQIIATSTVTYIRDWGNFRKGDLVEMCNETSNTEALTTVLTSKLASFSNISYIGCYDANRIAFFHMNGTQQNSGFYVMDLDATTPETEWTGMWHLFPAIKMVQDFPTGRYARWMANGTQWWDLTWICNRIMAIVNENYDIAAKWTIGRSVENRNIVGIVIGKGNRNVIIDGAIHGNEKTGAFVCLRIAELLISYYRSSPWWRFRLLKDLKIIIIPVLNPDGFVANSRYNFNGIDLNRQFPPNVTTTEPEAWAMRHLMGNYTPTVYVNLHEGYYWYPNWMIYGNYESDSHLTSTIEAMQRANDTFASLKHWGWFTDYNSSVWIGSVQTIAKGGYEGMAVAYASWQYSASCLLLESFVWSSKHNARQNLWGMDYYCTIVLSFLENNKRLSQMV